MNAIDKYKSHKWVRKVINSCTNYVQLNNCKNLIRNFEVLYNDNVLTTDLHMQMTSKKIVNLLDISKLCYQTEVQKGDFINVLDYIHETE